MVDIGGEELIAHIPTTNRIGDVENRSLLEEHYEAIPPCVRGEESGVFRAALLEKIQNMAVEANNDDPGHNFLIGLAYLDGIDVEVDAERALELIKGAAEAGVSEAMKQLVTMYETGKGVERDYYEGVRWREKHVGYLRKAYEAEQTGNRAARLISGLWDLGDAQYALGVLNAAEAAYTEMYTLSEQYAGSGENIYRRYLSVSCNKLGDTAREQGDLRGAQRYYEKGLAIREELAEKTGTIESKRDLSISCNRLGDTAREQGDLRGAQRYYEKGLAIAEELAEKTGMLQAHRDLAIILFNMGAFYYNNGISSDRAKSMFERVVEIVKKSGDDYLNELGKEAKDILDKYFQ